MQVPAYRGLRHIHNIGYVVDLTTLDIPQDEGRSLLAVLIINAFFKALLTKLTVSSIAISIPCCICRDKLIVADK